MVQLILGHYTRSHPIIRTVMLGAAATLAIYVLFHPFYGVFNLILSFAALLFWWSMWRILTAAKPRCQRIPSCPDDPNKVTHRTVMSH